MAVGTRKGRAPSSLVENCYQDKSSFFTISLGWILGQYAVNGGGSETFKTLAFIQAYRRHTPPPSSTIWDSRETESTGGGSSAQNFNFEVVQATRRARAQSLLLLFCTFFFFFLFRLSSTTKEHNYRNHEKCKFSPELHTHKHRPRSLLAVGWMLQISLSSPFTEIHPNSDNATRIGTTVTPD